MYKTYFVNVSSLALPHGVFLKGQPVKLQEDSYTKELLLDKVLSEKPLLSEAKKVVTAKTVENQARTLLEDVAEPAPVDVQLSDIIPDIASSPSLEEESAEAEPKQPARKKRNGRRKRGSERSS